MSTLLALVAVALATLGSAQFEIQHGTLVVAIVSQKNDYVVLAADSRSSLERFGVSGQSKNTSCKIIGLGGNALFFESGLSTAGTLSGKRWDAISTARNVFRESQKRDASALAIGWGNEALKWFYDSGQHVNLQSVVEAPDGRILTGGFVTFDAVNGLSFHSQTIFYDQTTRQLSRRESGQPPRPGQVFTVGVAGNLIAEFFEGKSDRAIDAFGPRGTIRLIGVDANTDSTIARKAIEFVMSYAEPKDKASVGKPIDIAILRQGYPIQWINRKRECRNSDDVTSSSASPRR